MSGKSTWKLQHTMVRRKNPPTYLLLSHAPITHSLEPSNIPPVQESPTVTELYNRLQEEMEKTGPSEPGLMLKGIPALAIRLPSNGYPECTCAGCGAECGENGEALQQCARCKGRKYCGRACQKLDWPRHRSDCVES